MFSPKSCAAGRRLAGMQAVEPSRVPSPAEQTARIKGDGSEDAAGRAPNAAKLTPNAAKLTPIAQRQIFFTQRIYLKDA